MKVKIRRLHPSAKLPTKATSGSACYDVYSLKDCLVPPDTKKILGTGLAFELPGGYGLDIRPRSGLASKGLIILNSPGTLDNDYRGELLISVMSLDSFIVISRGDRVAQIRLIPILDMEFEEIEELSKTKRGGKGFGSTD